MPKIDQEKVGKYISEKWKNPCPHCNSNDWVVATHCVEMREFNYGSINLDESFIVPVIPVSCTNCSVTVTLNAFMCGAIEKQKSS
jgi:hypothetical protein